MTTAGTIGPESRSPGEAAADVAKLGTDPKTGKRLKVCILNQYYAPDVASTGHLLHELATELVRLGFDVKVLTSRPSYGPKETWVDCPMREMLDGVDVHRLWTTRFSKDNLLGRASNYLTFMFGLFFRVLLTSKKDKIYLYTTNPPFLSIIGAVVSLFRRHAYVHLLHDAYPHMAVWVGTIRRRGLAEKIWHMVNRLCYARCKQAIVLCQKARTLVCESYGVPGEKVHVIPNWADGSVLTRRPKPMSLFAAEHKLTDRFTVMYSGNLGLYYEFETILDAAERLHDVPFRLVLIGSGGKRAWIKDQIVERELTNTLLLNYVPFDRLPDSLSAADASLVSIAEGIEGISFPSKLYTSLAVGRPIMALSERDSELKTLVEKHRVGMWCELGDADRMEANIRWLIDNPAKAARMGERARSLFERAFTMESCAERYARVLLASHPLNDRAERLVLESIGGEAVVEDEDEAALAAG